MRKDNLLIGFFLLFLGIVFLLININILNWSDIKSLWKLWPLVLVLIGIDIMFKEKQTLKDILFFIFIFGSLFIWLFIRVMKTSETKSGAINPSILESYVEEDEIYFSADLFGDVTIYPTNKKNIFVRTEFPKKLENEIKLEKEDNRYYLKLPGIKKLKHFKKYSLRIEIGLPINTILNLELSCGAIKGNFNFGDLVIRKIDFSFGAGFVNIEFPVLNKLVMEEFNISTGASSLEIDKLGNANFEKCEISSGASSLKIDLGGEWRKDSNVIINCALTNIHFKFPKNANFSIESEGILNPGLTKKLSKDPKFKIILKGALNSVSYTEYE